MGLTTSPGAIIRMSVEGADASERQINAVASSMNRLSDTVQSAMRNLASTIGLGAGLTQIVQLSDEYTKFTSQLRLATQSQREYVVAMADVKRIATDAQVGLASTGVLYARIANGTRELGVTQAGVAAITEVVNLSLKVSAATAAESASAQLQLSQAFASGTLRGEEFNAVNEAAPRLMKALADGIGVPVGALKKMATEGQITSKIMADVLPKALESLREEAKQIQTIGGALTVLKDKAMEFTAVTAQSNGTVSALTSSIGWLAENLRLVAGAVTTLTVAKLAQWFATSVNSAMASAAANRALVASNLAAAQAAATATGASSLLATARVSELRAAALAASGTVQLAIVTNGLVPAQAAAAVAVEAHTVAMYALAGAQRAATLTSRVLSGAMSFLGGPIALVVTVLGIAATAWSWYGSKADEANKLATASTVESATEMIARLDKQITKLQERNALLNVKPDLKTANQADIDGLARAYARLNNARNGTGEFAGQSLTMRQLAEIDLAHQYNTALAKTVTVQNLVAGAAAATRAERLDKWYGENGTQAQKLAAELKKLKDEFGTIPPAMEKLVRARFADKGAATTIKQEETAYTSLVTAIGEKIAAGQLELSGFNKLSDAQKLTIKLDEAIISGKNKLTPKHIAEARALIDIVEAQDRAIDRNKEMAKIQAEYAEQAGRTLADAIKEANANEELARTFGMTKYAIEQLAIARMEAKIEQLRGIEMADDEIATLERLIEAKRRSSVAMAALDGLEKQKAVWESIDKTAHDVFVSMWDSGKSTFDRLRDTLKSGLLDLLYQMTIKKWIFNISTSVTSGSGSLSMLGGGMSSAADTAQGGANLLSSLGSAGSMYSAYSASSLGQFMSGFSGSAGAASEMLGGAPLTGAARFGQMTSNGLSGAGGAAPYLGMAAGGYVGYNVAQNVGGFGGAVAGGLAGAGTIAAGGALTGALAGTGAMAGASAALAAVPVWGWVALAALSILGGMQEGPEQSTRLKFGSNNTPGNISINERGNEGKTDAYLGGTAQSSAGAFGTFGVVSSFWMDSGQPAVQSFIKTITQTDDALAQFLTATEKASVTTSLTGHVMTSTSGAEGSDPNGMGGLDAVFRDRLDVIFKTVEPGLESLIAGFKGTSAELATEAAALLSFRSALKDSGEAVFGVKVTLQELAALKEPTEQISAAMARVTAEFGVTNAVAGALGKTTVEVFGKVGLASLKAREELISAAGGIGSLAAMTGSFAQNYLSEAERTAPILAAVTESMKDLGYGSIQTLDQFKDLVMGLVNSGALATAEGATTFASLMKLQDAFALTHQAVDSLSSATRTAADITSERADLQKQYNQLTMTSEQLRSKERETIDASNLALFDQITRRQEVNATTDALKSLFDSLKTNREGILAYKDSLQLGTLSTLTPMEKYFETQRQYTESLTKARANPADSAAMSAAQTAATSFLTASQVIYASSASFVSDRSKVLGDMTTLSDIVGTQMSDTQRQLALAGDQVTGIATLNTTALGIQQAIVDLGTQGAVAAPIFDAGRYSAAANAGGDAMAAEIKLLRAQVAKLIEVTERRNADAERQKDEVADAIEQAGQATAEELGEAVKKVGWEIANPSRRAAL